MKKITLVLSVLMLCVIVNAQQQVATLVHNGNVRIFYGANGFVEAHNAAVSGDAINLSAGVFESCNITKNITLRGAGWKGAESTIIDGEVYLEVPSRDTVSRLYIEGIYFDDYLHVDSALNASSIMRCFIEHLEMSNDFGTMANCVMSNVDFTFRRTVSATFVNCVLCEMYMTFSHDINVINSICTPYNHGYSRPLYGRYDNCIFVDSYGNTIMHSSATANNCVYCGSSTTFFNSVYGSNNVSVGSSLDALFEDPSNITTSFNENASFVLTQTAKTQYLGDDGTEVGIYGGLVPFSEQPSFPRITKMQVGKKTTADGKLSVDIEVTSAE